MPPVILRRIRNDLLRRLPFNADPPLLPVVAVRQARGQPNEPAICQGLVCLTVMFVAYGAYTSLPAQPLDGYQ